MSDRHFLKYVRSFLTILVALSSLWVGFGTNAALADSHISVEPGGTIVRVPANGEASISIIGFCGDLDDAFPHFIADLGPIGGRIDTITDPNDIAFVNNASQVLQVLHTAIVNGRFTDINNVATLNTIQDTVWSLTDDLPGIGDTGLLPSATSLPLPPLVSDSDVIAVTDAVNQGLISATIDGWNRIPDSKAMGLGTYILRNQTAGDLFIYWPMGTVLRPGTPTATNNDFQPMVTVVLNALPEAPRTILPPEEVVQTGMALRPLLAHLEPTDIATLASELTAKNVAPKQVGPPFALSLPSIGVQSTIKSVGWRQVMQPDGKLISEWEVAENAVGWHANTALPNVNGNIVLAGHNSIYGSVFQDLHELAQGDLATVQYDGIFYKHRIDEVKIMKYENASAAERNTVFQYIQPSMNNQLTLISCFPDFGTSHRVVVQASPIGQYDPASTFMQMAQ